MSVIIEPNVLEYHTPLTETSTSYITLHNQTEDVKAFKIKTTAPKLYCVRPNAAILQPGETVKVSIIFLGLSEEPVDYKCKDKFLVIVLPAPYEIESGRTVSDVWNDLETEFKARAIQKKIKVMYNPVPAAEPAKEHKESTPVQEKQPESTQQQIPPQPVESTAESKQEKNEVYEKKEEQPRSTTPIPAASMEPPLSSEQQDLNSKISPSTMLFIAIIVLALGWLYY